MTEKAVLLREGGLSACPEPALPGRAMRGKACMPSSFSCPCSVPSALPPLPDGERPAPPLPAPKGKTRPPPRPAPLRPLRSPLFSLYPRLPRPAQFSLPSPLPALRPPSLFSTSAPRPDSVPARPRNRAQKSKAPQVLTHVAGLSGKIWWCPQQESNLRPTA